MSALSPDILFRKGALVSGYTLSEKKYRYQKFDILSVILYVYIQYIYFFYFFFFYPLVFSLCIFSLIQVVSNSVVGKNVQS